MTAMAELQPITEKFAVVLSGRANELAQQIQQAAIQPVSSSDKLELVDQLTDYVSDALAEGSLADDELQYLFQLTAQLGDQAKFVSPPGRNLAPANQTKEETAGLSLSMTVDELSAVKQSRTTADLLECADDIANISGSLQGTGSSYEDELDIVHSDYPVITEAQANAAHRTPKQAMTSREAAAKALVKAARHGSSSRSSKDTPSRYMDSSSSRLVIPVHETASGKLEAEGVIKAILQPGRRHATPAYLPGLQSNVTSIIPAHIRLYQLSDTWRRHKEQLRVEQQDRDSRAASPTPPARLSSQVRQRAADRLYAHAMQRQKRQQAARALQDEQASPPRGRSPSSSPRRNAPDFFQRQQDLLARRQQLAEQRRPRDEESLQHCTGRPVISAFAHSLRRSTSDLLAWHRRKEERLQQMRSEQAQQEDEEVTLIPSINPTSRHMALHLARRVAHQDPRLLTVIQSQPQGWVLGPRPASPRRRTPTPGATSTGRSQQALNPPWVQGGSGTSSMRLVQKAAEKHLPVQHRYPDQHRGVQDGGLHQSREGYEEAPWMGHGGVHHMEPGHIGACAKGHATEQGKNAVPMQRMHSPSGAAFPHAHQETAVRCAVDPIEAPAPAWILDSAALESPSTLRPPALSAPGHMAAASFGGDAMHAHQGSPASTLNSHKLQTSLSVQADAGQFTDAGEQGSPAGMPAFAAVASSSVSSSLKRAEAGSPEKEDASAAWNGFAAHAGTNTASVMPDVQEQNLVVGDNMPEYGGSAPSEVLQQSSQPESFVSFGGFDVPEDDLPKGDILEDNIPLPTAQNSPEAGVTQENPSEGEEKSHAMSGNPAATGISANASQVRPAKREGLGGATEMKPLKVDRRVSGTPAKTHRSSSGRISRGSTQDVPSRREGAAGASKAVGAGPRYKDGQLAQARLTLAAATTSAVSGKTLRALARKAATEASVAASILPLPARVSQHSAVSESPILVNTGEQQEAMPQAEELGQVQVMSMHSIVTQSPAPLPQKKQLSGLNVRAVEAAMKQVMAAGGSEHGSHKQATKAAGRRLSTERGSSQRPELGPKAESRYIFSPATANIGGYKQKHGVNVTSAVRV